MSDFDGVQQIPGTDWINGSSIAVDSNDIVCKDYYGIFGPNQYIHNANMIDIWKDGDKTQWIINMHIYIQLEGIIFQRFQAE